MTKASTKRIKKFSTPQRIFHWMYGIAWILLAITGIIFVWRGNPAAPAVGLGPYLQGTVGQVARLIHRISAIALMAAPFVWIFGDPKSILPDMKELFSFGLNDLKYMLVAPLHYTIGKPELPPQGKYNGGHKTNFYIVVLTFIGFVVSGLVMWFGRGMVTDDTFNLMQVIHSASFWIGTAMTLLHIYLTMIHPFTSRSLSAMVDGWMDLGYAKMEHGLWVEKAIANGTAEITDEERTA